MSHLVPSHGDLSLAHSSLGTALQIDPNQQQQQQQPPPQPGPGRKRKKQTENGEESGPSEPRRLRRSHEACARCRSKKIKCDSKYPRCTACANSGTACQQEDRHRQTLTPRGHTERIERQLAQCEALLKRHVPGFDISNIEDILAREGIDIDPPGIQMGSAFAFAPQRSYPPMPPKGFPYPPHPQHHMMQGYPLPMYGAPGAPFPPPPAMGMQGPHFNPHIHPQFQHSMPPPPIQLQPQRPLSASGGEVKGQDPQSNDMSTSQALAKNFGVSPAIVDGLKLTPATMDKEDLAVGSSGLTSGRDRGISTPRDGAKWLFVSIIRDTTLVPISSFTVTPKLEDTIDVWLPRDRDMVKRIISVYFDRLNYHRPIFFRAEFERTVETLYDGKMNQHDPGFICSLYLVLALGTLSELNHRVFQHDNDFGRTNHISTEELMGNSWPAHEEFFECALVVKPDLRVTVSSLQALILLHWYLYTERQGRTLWRLVGSLVRIGIELGLHHDPTVQENTFSDEECQLRIRLWSIILLHDRGTSILLGRPLAISPSDSNTPRPSALKGPKPDVSDHFLISAPLVEIQADIINSLYTPTPLSADKIMNHATRIIKKMTAYKNTLPESYKFYFGGTEGWPLEKRYKLVQDLTEDQGLTFLKIGISRILLLRALFSSTQLEYTHRHKALDDAIVTSHNIIIVHNQLIRFPDIAFFVSPIPLHISAMVILYGHMSHCDRIPRQVALEDVWMALDMLPSLRWRWERKDLNGGHPLIAKVAEKVLEVNLHQVGPPSHPLLLNEQDWDMNSPQQQMQQTSNTKASINYNNNNGGNGSYSAQSTPKPQQAQQPQQQLADVPAVLFYSFYPEKAGAPTPTDSTSGANNSIGSEFNHLLTATGGPAQPLGMYGYHPSQDSFMLEEKDTVAVHPGMQIWMNNGGVKGSTGGSSWGGPSTGFKY